MSYKTKAVHLSPCCKFNTRLRKVPYFRESVYTLPFHTRTPLDLVWAKRIKSTR